MEIRGRVQQVVVKDGKDHDLRLELHLSDEDVVQLIRWRHTDLTVNIEPIQYQTRLPGMDGEAGDAAEKTARFWIDDERFPIRREEEDGEYRLTGKELRELVDPPVEQIWQWVEDPFNAGQQKRELVEDSALVSLEDGDRFTTMAPESTNGQVEPDEAHDGDEMDLNMPTPIGARGRGAE